MKPVLLHLEASAELQDAVRFYEAQRKGLGTALTDEFQRAVSLVRDYPEIGAVYKQTAFRRIALSRFPYTLYYLDMPNLIWIVAVAHGRRKPGYWLIRSAEHPPHDPED